MDDALALRTRAPEVALVLGERAAALAESAGANDLWIQAESLAVHSKVRLGHRASTVGRAVTALRAAEDAGRPVLAAQLRTDLAVCARSVGAPLTGLAALRPVLTVAGLSSVQRASALCHLVGCLGTFGRKVELDRVLLEGDRLISKDSKLGDADRLVARALLRVGVSAHRRRHGDLVGAADAARTGIGFLDDLEDARADGGLARVRLALELVCVLLDRGDAKLALEVAEPLLAAPERAASIAPLSWLRLAIATRVHLADGSAESAARLLRHAVHSTGRHGLYSLTSRLWFELAHVEERVGEASEAIQCLYRARSAEQLHTRVSSQARALLTGAFGTGEQAPVDLAEMVASAGQAASTNAAAQPPEPRKSPEPEAAAEAATSRTSGKRRADERGAASRPRVVLPMLRLASGRDQAPDTASAGAGPAGTPPMSEPPAPRTSTEDVSATEVTAITPIITDDMEPPETVRRRRKPETENRQTESTGPADRAGERSDRPVASVVRTRSATRKTRHDAEHGSVAARSVLDRLGISPGTGGGRRRADKDDPDRSNAVSSEEQPGASAPSGTETPSSEEPIDTPSRANVAAASESVSDDGWLPRLKLPPALAPLEVEHPVPTDSGRPPPSTEPQAPEPARRPDDGGSVPDAGASGAGEPAESNKYGVPAEEPPPDAGLAELLAHALAEHQAGTASAAALVRSLGVDDEEPHVNGKRLGEG